MAEPKDKILESLENNFESFQNDFSNMITDYKKKSKRLDRIIKQSDKQQLQVMHLNEELDNYKDHLEKKVIEKTKELHDLNASLEERVKNAVEENRKKDKQINEQAKFVQIGELMSNIAHHWRQPLNAISTSASGIMTLREMGLSDIEDENRSIEEIITSTKFLSNVIQDFADFIADNQNQSPSEFSICDNFNKSLNIIISSLQNNNIEIIKDFPKEEIIIKSISSKLSNVFLSILKNAQDALIQLDKNTKRIITITILQEKKYISISIKDNANGIADEILPKIFDPYFTTKHQSSGTGLGLYTVRDDLEQHLNGNIEVVNSTSGAEFIIKIPSM